MISYPEVREGDDNAKSDVDSGVYEKHYKIGPWDTVLDLGAHVGYFSELAARKGARVIAFEPEHYNFLRLKERLGADPKVTLVNAAAWDSDVEMGIDINPKNSGGHTLFGRPEFVECPVVKCVDINSWLEREGISPTFAKIDTEGSEYRIVSSLALPARKIPMAIEIHSISLYSHCRSILALHGYDFEPKQPHIGVCYAIP